MTHRRTLRPPNANRLTPPSSQLTKASGTVPTKVLLPQQPEFALACMLDEPAKAHRRSAHPVYPRSVKPEFSPARLGWVCVAEHSRFRPSCNRHRPGKPPWVRSGWIGFACQRHAPTREAQSGRTGEAARRRISRTRRTDFAQNVNRAQARATASALPGTPAAPNSASAASAHQTASEASLPSCERGEPPTGRPHGRTVDRGLSTIDRPGHAPRPSAAKNH